jgi:hypothetical protein
VLGLKSIGIGNQFDVRRSTFVVALASPRLGERRTTNNEQPMTMSALTT